MIEDGMLRGQASKVSGRRSEVKGPTRHSTFNFEGGKHSLPRALQRPLVPALLTSCPTRAQLAQGHAVSSSPCDISLGAQQLSPSFPPQRLGRSWGEALSEWLLEPQPRGTARPDRLACIGKATVPVLLTRS